MDKNLDKMLSLLVEEIERVEVTKQKFGSVMKEIKNKIDLGKYPAFTANCIETIFTTKISPARLDGLKIAGIDGEGLLEDAVRIAVPILIDQQVAPRRDDVDV